MAKIEINKIKSGGRHTVKVTLSFEDNGNGKSTTEQMRVVYRGISLDEGEQIEAQFNATTNKRQALIDALVHNVVELPDLVDNGQPVPPSAEFFATLDTYYLNRINQAITDDRQGNE
jgi:hypothetical protein